MRWPSKERCLIYDFTIYDLNFNLIKVVEDINVFLTQKVLNSDNLSIAYYKQKVCMSLSQRNRKWKKQLKESIDIYSYLIRQSLFGYHNKSGIAIFVWRITWNYAYNPFNKIFWAKCYGFPITIHQWYIYIFSSLKNSKSKFYMKLLLVGMPGIYLSASQFIYLSISVHYYKMNYNFGQPLIIYIIETVLNHS